jgi:hypothetical protein
MFTDLLLFSCSPSLDMSCLEGSKGIEIDDNTEDDDDGGTAQTAD